MSRPARLLAMLTTLVLTAAMLVQAQASPTTRTTTIQAETTSYEALRPALTAQWYRWAKADADQRWYEAAAAAERAAQEAQERLERQKAADARRAAQRPTGTLRAASASSIRATGSINGHPCGGALPYCWVLSRETGGTGSPTSWNPTGCYERKTGHRGCGGKWQFSWSTWGGYGGYDTANLAPEWLQDEKAAALWAAPHGCHHWAAC